MNITTLDPATVRKVVRKDARTVRTHLRDLAQLNGEAPAVAAGEYVTNTWPNLDLVSRIEFIDLVARPEPK